MFRKRDTIQPVEFWGTILLQLSLQHYRLGITYSWEGVGRILHDYKYVWALWKSYQPVHNGMTHWDWIYQMLHLASIYGWFWINCRRGGLRKSYSDAGRLELYMHLIGATVDDVETDDPASSDLDSDEDSGEETNPASRNRSNTRLDGATDDDWETNDWETDDQTSSDQDSDEETSHNGRDFGPPAAPPSREVPANQTTHATIPPNHTDTHSFKTPSHPSSSNPDSLSSVIPSLQFSLTASPIMVLSAILGFPRMGVNRDLKKATEACMYRSSYLCCSHLLFS